MLKISFVKNPGAQCMQANMIMVLQYFFPDKQFSFAEINKKMRRKKGKWTFPVQAAVVLKDLGLKCKAYSSKNMPQNREGLIGFFKKAFGGDYDLLIKNINFDVTEYFYKRAKKEGLFKVRKHSLEDFAKYVKRGYIIIPCIDWNILCKKKGPFAGHFVTILNIDKNNIWIHDPDEGPNLRYSRGLFNKAYTAQAIDDDILLIFGKLNN